MTIELRETTQDAISFMRAALHRRATRFEIRAHHRGYPINIIGETNTPIPYIRWDVSWKTINDPSLVIIGPVLAGCLDLAYLELDTERDPELVAGRYWIDCINQALAEWHDWMNSPNSLMHLQDQETIRPQVKLSIQVYKAQNGIRVSEEVQMHFPARRIDMNYWAFPPDCLTEHPHVEIRAIVYDTSLWEKGFDSIFSLWQKELDGLQWERQRVGRWNKTVYSRPGTPSFGTEIVGQLIAEQYPPDPPFILRRLAPPTVQELLNAGIQ